MNNLEQTTEQQREKILELIGLMTDKTIPELMRNSYHHRCIVKLENYCGKDFDDLINKYLCAEKKMGDMRK